jgi:hypothetical protein
VCEERSPQTADADDATPGCAHEAPDNESPKAGPNKLELADIFRRYADSLGRLSRHVRRTIQALARCRTRALGTHRRICEHCGHAEEAPNSCRNRHCPKCQGLDETRWLERQMRDVLPVRYHHLVFTVPHELHIFFRTAPELAFQLLFSTVAETLHEVAARPSNLGARIGFTTILHTWNQRLGLNPHAEYLALATPWVYEKKSI